MPKAPSRLKGMDWDWEKAMTSEERAAADRLHERRLKIEDEVDALLSELTSTLGELRAIQKVAAARAKVKGLRKVPFRLPRSPSA